jgi:hypothetical protein
MLNMNMQIKFELETINAISATFFDILKPLKIGHSATSGDAFQLLLNRIFEVREHIQTQNTYYFPHHFQVFWDDECVGYVWDFTMENWDAQAVLKIYKMPTPIVNVLNTNNSDLILSENISFETLLENIHSSLLEMYQIFGLFGYKKVWTVGNFPVSEFIALQARFQNIEIIPLDVEDWTQKIAENVEKMFLFKN